MKLKIYALSEPRNMFLPLTDEQQKRAQLAQYFLNIKKPSKRKVTIIEALTIDEEEICIPIIDSEIVCQATDGVLQLSGGELHGTIKKIYCTKEWWSTMVLDN